MTSYICTQYLKAFRFVHCLGTSAFRYTTAAANLFTVRRANKKEFSRAFTLFLLYWVTDFFNSFVDKFLFVLLYEPSKCWCNFLIIYMIYRAYRLWFKCSTWNLESMLFFGCCLPVTILQCWCIPGNEWLSGSHTLCHGGWVRIILVLCFPDGTSRRQF